MKIPPVVVYKNLTFIEDMLTATMGVNCVDTIAYDECFASVTFNDVPMTDEIQSFINKVVCGLDVVYDGKDYMVTSQYII